MSGLANIISDGVVVSLNEPLTKVLEGNGLPVGRLIASSKSEYSRAHPFNRPFFNGCIFELAGGNEVWFGDIDINDEETLNALIKSALDYNNPFILTTETPYRFSDKLQIGNLMSAGGLDFIKIKSGWVGGGKIFNKLSKDELDKLYNNLELAVVTEDGMAKSSDNFDKVIFSPENRLTEEDEYGAIDYIKSGIKLLSKFF